MFETNDSSDDETLTKQVLPTNDHGNEPIDLNKIPTTGEEYLRQVRYQSSQLPDFQTVTKDIRKNTNSNHTKNHAWHKLFTSSNSNSTIINKHTVSLDWQNEQCQTFSNIRNDYFQMRDRLRKLNRNSKISKLKNSNSYWKFCFGNQIPFQSSLSNFQLESNLLPTMTKMINLTQSQLHELLQYEIDWLKQSDCSIYLALYTYATLVAIEKPINEDVTYTMRQIALAWKDIRMKLLTPITADHSIDDSLIKSCDLFVCLIGRYFGQFDLADGND